MMNQKTTKKTAKNQTLYAAADLHGDNGFYAIMDEQDRRIYGKRLPNCLPVVLRELAPYRTQLTYGMAVESTFNWYGLVDGLPAEGYPVTLVNPAQVGDDGGLKNTHDQTDGFWLAPLPRLKLLPQGYIYPKDQRGGRAGRRRRMMWVNPRTAHVLSFQSLVERQTGESLNAHRIQRLAETEVTRWLPADEPQWMGPTHGAVIPFLDAKIQAYEKAVLAKVKRRAAYEIWLGWPGIGRILALVILRETGEMSRFAKVGNYVSYGRWVKAEAFSNERKKSDHHRKCGNRY